MYLIFKLLRGWSEAVQGMLRGGVRTSETIRYVYTYVPRAYRWQYPLTPSPLWKFSDMLGKVTKSMEIPKTPGFWLNSDLPSSNIWKSMHRTPIHLSYMYVWTHHAQVICTTFNIRKRVFPPGLRGPPNGPPGRSLGISVQRFWPKKAKNRIHGAVDFTTALCIRLLRRRPRCRCSPPRGPPLWWCVMMCKHHHSHHPRGGGGASWIKEISIFVEIFAGLYFFCWQKQSDEQGETTTIHERTLGIWEKHNFFFEKSIPLYIFLRAVQKRSFFGCPRVGKKLEGDFGKTCFKDFTKVFFRGFLGVPPKKARFFPKTILRNKK